MHHGRQCMLGDWLASVVTGGKGGCLITSLQTSKQRWEQKLDCEPHATSHIDSGPSTRVHPPNSYQVQTPQIVTKSSNKRLCGGGYSAFRLYHSISIICGVAVKGPDLSVQEILQILSCRLRESPLITGNLHSEH